MSNNSAKSGFWAYVVECGRLLYWIYFKPFTLENWLRDIHPGLKPKDNPFDKQAEFGTNPRLRRYAGQVCWLTAIVPILAVLLVAPVYTLASGESFNWFRSCTFLAGWFLGRVLDRHGNKNRVFITLIAFLIIFLAPQFLSGVAEGVAFGVTFGVAAGVTFGVTTVVVVGVAEGVAFGVALGVALILGVLRVYFWLPELLWTLILFLSSANGKRVNCLRYLPPRFDELVILPLPFMDRMIVEAYQENPEAALDTIDYLTSSTNQQKVAAKAITGIAIDSLNRCQKLSDIVDIAKQLTWISSPPPKELGTVFPQFLDISQDVRASQEATSPYRRYELLNTPISALQEISQSLAFGKNTFTATQFGSIVQHWLTILETAKRTLEETAKQSQEIKQVYIAGNSLDPATAKHRFKGRIDIFREIETLAVSESPPVLLLYGGRRTGKTSALKYLPHKIGANIIPLLVDVQGAASATTLKGFAENLARQMSEAAMKLPRKLHLPHPDSNQLAEDPFPALQSWLTEIERKCSDKRFLLCFDEYERLSEVVKETNSRAPLNFIRNLLQHQKKWILLFSGSHQLSELDNYWSDYLINTRALQMSFLQESEARELILQPVEDFPNIYEPTAVDEIIQLTHCQPYLVQLVCYELVELLNRDIRRNQRQANIAKATAQDVQTIIPTVLERGDQYFRELWTSLEDSDRNLLRRVIQSETPTQQDKGVVRKLARKEILTQEGNAFQVPLVQRFVEQLLEDE
ncbi:AAA family ATPase [Nodularia spumigena CS-588/05]|uniref:nSTAND1 domain-containing NTPase n=1 Tax=Nodularia spumigena TaxID=70799 RepID=UPI00232DA8CC|nr:AAA family ATPase [Nodularia spumigena]MDB9353220.1 AAA family ATPase [Nodularia spumigena CS-588/05]